MYQRPHSCFNYYFYIHRMEESPKQHSSMPCMAEAMSKIKTAASTTQYSGSESSSPQRGFRKAVTSILMVNVYLGPGYRNFSRRMRLQADDRISTSRKIPKDQNGNLRQSMETLYRRIPPGYDGRGLGGSRKHRMSRYVFRLCRRTVPLPENRRKIRRTLPCCTQRSRNLSILRLADMGNRQPHRNVPLQRRPRCLQKNNQADVRRTRPVTICRNARAIQTYGRANLSGSRRDRRHQVPPPRKRIHRRRLLLHLSKLRGRLPRVRPHDGKNRHVRVPHALHPGLYKYRDRRRKSEILFRTSPRVHSESSP